MAVAQLVEYAPVANLIITAGGLAVLINLFRAFESTKSAQIAALEERLKLAEAPGVDAFSEKLEAVRKYYESYYELPIVQRWFDQSLSSISSLKQSAEKRGDSAEIAFLDNELRVRRELLSRYLQSTPKNSSAKVTKIALDGDWVVLGRHPADKDYYRGTLRLESIGDSLTGTWTFPSGTIRIESADGLQLGDHVAFALSDGVALYQLIEDSILMGGWIRGDLHDAGTEECRRCVEA